MKCIYSNEVKTLKEEIFYLNDRSNGLNLMQELLKINLTTSIWHIWIERNHRVVNNKRKDS